MARPREFDSDAALDRVMDVFWAKGYEATSLDDLCAVTGLSRSSLYGAFGGKHDLLLASIARYSDKRSPAIAGILSKPRPIRESIADLAAQFIEAIIAGPGRRGCFLGNCAAELPRTDRVAIAQVRAGLEATETQFRTALEQARARGELRDGANIDALARFLMAGFQGLRLVGKANPDRRVLEDIAATIVRCLD